MGKLGNQRERDNYAVNYDHLDEFLKVASQLAKNHATTIETVVSASHVLEMRRKNDLAVQSGDNWDEQAAGFGNCLDRIAKALENNEK